MMLNKKCNAVYALLIVRAVCMRVRVFIGKLHHLATVSCSVVTFALFLSYLKCFVLTFAYKLAIRCAHLSMNAFPLPKSINNIERNALKNCYTNDRKKNYSHEIIDCFHFSKFILAINCVVFFILVLLKIENCCCSFFFFSPSPKQKIKQNTTKSNTNTKSRRFRLTQPTHTHSGV